MLNIHFESPGHRLISGRNGLKLPTRQYNTGWVSLVNYLICDTRGEAGG